MENWIQLENLFAAQTPNLIKVIRGSSQNTFQYVPETGLYNCQYLQYRVQLGVGLPRAGFCGNLTKAEVIAEVRRMVPAGGRRNAHTRKQKARKNRSRKHRSIKSRH